MKTAVQDLTTLEAIDFLKEIGDGQAAEEIAELVQDNPSLEETKVSDLDESYDLPRAKWRGTEHSYGFIESSDSDLLDIKFASTIEADATLKGQRVNIKLGSLYTINYPGWGRHNVLMHFKCKHANESNDDTLTIEFQQKFKSKEGEGAGNLGDYIFNGLKVPNNGLQFEVQTINVSNDGDEEALRVLESDTIKNGLQLANASFSTLAPFTKMAQGVMGLLLKRNRNKLVQQFTIGFDFDETAVELARLQTGTYVVVQTKKNLLDWDEWCFQKGTGLVVNKEDTSKRLELNHITFNVTRAV